ncbi:MAG: hypothetical protein N3A54_01520 [Patescibacteria group bacterium]|nr:hypothetical protein [Patescibacteria group bacterium]
MKEFSFYVDKVVEDITNLVSKTLGPDGNYILIQGNESFVTKDGVTVAKNFRYIEEMGYTKEEVRLLNNIASIFVEMSRKTDFSVGDGTTSTIVFAGNLYKRLALLKKQGYNVRDLLDGVRYGVRNSKKYISKNSYSVKDSNQIERIAFLSANNDTESAELLRLVFDKIGKNGMVTFNKSNAPKMSEVKFSKGFRFPSGYAHKTFINTQSKKTVEYDNPYVLVTDFSFTRGNEFLQLFHLLEGKKRPLIILCEKISGEALAFLAESNRNNVISVLPIQSPFRGVEREEFLEDVALFTGAKMISAKENIAFPVVKLADFGEMDSVECGIRSTVFVGSKGDKEKIKEHVEELKKRIQDCPDDAAIENLYMRIARLTSGAAEIIVGGNTESEVLERRYRLEDALKAVNNSFVYGYVPGGGLIYLHIKRGLKKEKKELENSLGLLKGFEAYCSTLDSIIETLICNSNLSFERYKVKDIKEKIEKGLSKNIGFDFKEKVFCNFLDNENLIIEPAGISQEVIENSLSIVSLLINTCGFTF